MQFREPKYKGSRPPPQKRPRTNGWSVFFIMGLVIAASFIASGGSTPVDPNGPDGPPRLEPYFNPDDYGEQQLITVPPKQGNTDNNDVAKKNLQLKTFLVQGCSTKTAFYFVVDTSGSMKLDNKLEKEQNALRDLLKVEKVGGKAVVGITTFSKDVEEQISLNFLDAMEPEIEEAIDEMKADGWTSTRDGMALAKEKLQQAIEVDEFPGYKYALILMTDGVPEIPNEPRTCLVTAPEPLLASGIRCFAQEQDPRVPTNIAEEIKRLGVEIYSINIYSETMQSDVAMYPYLKALLQEVASPPLDTHYFESIEGNNLDKILTKICDPVANY